jgi:hypothetical protein
MKATNFLLVITLAATSIANAGTAVEFKAGKDIKDLAPPEEVPLNVINARVDQTFQSDFKSGFRVRKDGNNNTNTWHYRITASRRVPLNENWYLRLGVDAQRFDFGDNRSIAPNTLQNYAGVLALEYFREGSLGFYVETRPGIYFSHEVRGSDFDMPTDAVAFYPLVDGKLWLIGGVSFARLREYPVLPVLGLRWLINDKWDLQACLPEPKLIYKVSENLSLNVGGELFGGSFRTDSSDVKDINNTRVDYYEVRAGAGLSYTGWKPLTIDFGGGYALVRKFHFEDTDRSASTDPAPYLSLRAGAEF